MFDLLKAHYLSGNLFSIKTCHVFKFFLINSDGKVSMTENTCECHFKQYLPGKKTFASEQSTVVCSLVHRIFHTRQILA